MLIPFVFRFVVASALAAATIASAQQVLPAGTLRAAYLGTNPVQGRIDPASGRLIGPVAELMPALAARLKVAFELKPLPNAAAVVAAVNDGSVDIGFLAYERERAAQVDYSEPYAIMGNAFLVLESSPIRRSVEIDRAGVVVGAVRGTAPQIWISENLRQARITMVAETPPHAELVAMLTSGAIHAFAANRQRMLDTAKTDTRVRVLADNFSSVPQAIVVRKGSAALLAEVNRFVIDPGTTALVREGLRRADLPGVDPAR